MEGVIYQIKNKKNGKKYIGSTTDLEDRRKRHLRDLRNGNHHSIILQRAWEKYGEESFKFEIFKHVDKNLREKEKELLDNGEYNVSSDASGGNLIDNHPDKKEIEEKKKRKYREYIDGLSDEERREVFGREGETNGNWKGGIHKEKMRCECGNKKVPQAEKCRECYDKRGKNNPFYGKSHSEETKKKLSKQKEGVYNGDQNKPVTNGEEIFSSLGEASRSENVVVGTIWNRLKSEGFPNWDYV